MSSLQEAVGRLSPRARRVYWAFARKAADGVPIVPIEAAVHWWAAYKRDIMWKSISTGIDPDRDPLLLKLREWAPPRLGGILYYPLTAIHFWDSANEDEKEVARCVLRLLNIPLSILDKDQLELDPLARFQHI